MNDNENLVLIVKAIIDSSLYMVLGTADDEGQPWVTPVYFTASKYKEFYWISSPEAKHSRNLEMHSQISLVIFNSQVPVGEGQAVYMYAAAVEVARSDLNTSLSLYNSRIAHDASQGVRMIKSEEVQSPALYRLYRAVASEYWVLDPGAHPDRRTPVKM